jgi:hypothetical protein
MSCTEGYLGQERRLACAATPTAAVHGMLIQGVRFISFRSTVPMRSRRRPSYGAEIEAFQKMAGASGSLREGTPSDGSRSVASRGGGKRT